MFKSVSDLCDVVSMLMGCTEDKTFLLTTMLNTSDFILPSIKNVPNSSWNSTVKQLFKEIFNLDLQSNFKMHVLRIYKVWVPNHSTGVIYHCVYGIQCNNEFKRNSKAITSAKYRGRLQWLSDMEVVQCYHHDMLRTPEIVDFVRLFEEQYPNMVNRAIVNRIPSLNTEFLTTNTLVEVTENEIIINEKDKQFGLLILSASLSINIQHLLYREFLLNCFPSLFMSRSVFGKFITEIGWPKTDTNNLFHAADVRNLFGLTFRDFLVILAVIDPNTNQISLNELRNRFIFRYFDRDHDNILNYSEFKACISVLRMMRRESTELMAVNSETDNILQDMNINPNNCYITNTIFSDAVSNSKVRGISTLLRVGMPINTYIVDIQEREKHVETTALKSVTPWTDDRSSQRIIQSLNVNKSFSFVNQTTNKMPDFEIALHTICFHRDTFKFHFDDIFDLENSVSQQNLLASMNIIKRNNSTETFNDKAISSEILKNLHYLAQLNSLQSTSKLDNIFYKTEPIGTEYSTYNWGHVTQSSFAKMMLKLANHVKNIVSTECRLLSITSPVYILGDIHGNFTDLLSFEKLLWNYGHTVNTTKLLFLGDYVDRGKFSLEVVAYLFAIKVQNPTKVFLVRGNHEIRYIQTLFTFQTECILKLGDRLGQDVWSAINAAFDNLPLAALVDSKLFCCHGGIPPPWLCPVLNAINSIPLNLSDPELQSPLAWELMWNDPIRQSSVTETGMIEIMATEGFGGNKRRGTGHVFTIEALERFLSVNNLSHVIRAHEMMPSGFKVHHNGKLITVFSSSHYCGGINEAACIIVEEHKIRFLQMTTD